MKIIIIIKIGHTLMKKENRNVGKHMAVFQLAYRDSRTVSEFPRITFFISVKLANPKLIVSHQKLSEI